MELRDILARRTDLSTFLVHLTRDTAATSAREAFRGILAARQIEARTMFGAAKSRLEQTGLNFNSQKTVCFTETPLEFTKLLLEELPTRGCQFQPYGIAITKRVAREKGVNPVWYIDISPGHDWLINPLNDMIEVSLAANAFDGSAAEAVAPFVEQMGTRVDPSGNRGYRKEFWWEREWRFRGDFSLPARFIGLCPEAEIGYFESQYPGFNQRYIDPRWGLERIIAHLAGFGPEEVELP